MSALEEGTQSRKANLRSLLVAFSFALDDQQGPKLPARVLAFDDGKLNIEHQAGAILTMLEPPTISSATGPDCQVHGHDRAVRNYAFGDDLLFGLVQVH